MKAVLGITLLVGLFGRCQDDQLPTFWSEPWWHHNPTGQNTDAGVAKDAGADDEDARAPEAGGGGQPVLVGGMNEAGAGGSVPSSPMQGGASGSAMTSSSGGTGPCSGPPGLYAGDTCVDAAADLRVYQPQFELWVDGAKKERHIYLPPGTQIDTSNPNRWTFPVGTRIYKTFSIDGMRIETRLMQKNAPAASIDSWSLVAYVWSADQQTATEADPAGVSDWLGTNHDVPSQAQCKTCHTMTGADAVNGFGAIQLNHSPDGTMTLQTLLDEGWLTNASGTAPNISIEESRIPGDDVTRAGLGYLHANCGNCHGGSAPKANLTLWSTVMTDQLADAAAVKSAVCQCLMRWTGRSNADGDPFLLRIAPGHSSVSGVVGRMSTRTVNEQMPPLGTKLVDTVGLAAVSAFIDSLDPSMCDASPPSCPPPSAAGAGGMHGGSGGMSGSVGAAMAGTGAGTGGS